MSINTIYNIALLYREAGHSLSSAGNDRRIMEMTGSGLRGRGYCVKTYESPEFSVGELCDFDLVLSMARSVETHKVLSRVESHGVLVINSVSATLATLRSNMYPMLTRCGVPLPATWLVDVGTEVDFSFPVWVKRKDYHHLDRRDVVRLNNIADYRAAQHYFRSIGHSQFFLQEHVPGRRVKFYGVYDRVNESLTYFKADSSVPATLYNSVCDAVLCVLREVQLEFFGVDLMISDQGDYCFVDLNSWPSYKDFAVEVADVIVEYLIEVFAG